MGREDGREGEKEQAVEEMERRVRETEMNGEGRELMKQKERRRGRRVGQES